MRVTPAKLRAQRANARRSTGPRTAEGRLRSSLNSLKAHPSPLGPVARAAGRRPEEFLRIWRDLLALFWFVEPVSQYHQTVLQTRLESLARAWWMKFSLAALANDGQTDADIESRLGAFLTELRQCRQKYLYRLRSKFGTDGRRGLGALRESIEARLGFHRDAPASATQAAGGRVELFRADLV